MTEELKPCPFCKSKVELKKFDSSSAYGVICTDKNSTCEKSGLVIAFFPRDENGEITIKKAIKAWNTRAAEAEPKPAPLPDDVREAADFFADDNEPDIYADGTALGANALRYIQTLIRAAEAEKAEPHPDDVRESIWYGKQKVVNNGKEYTLHYAGPERSDICTERYIRAAEANTRPAVLEEVKMKIMRVYEFFQKEDFGDEEQEIKAAAIMQILNEAIALLEGGEK